jgi:DNA-binding NarL/FixJ family response regulator
MRIIVIADNASGGERRQRLVNWVREMNFNTLTLNKNQTDHPLNGQSNGLPVLISVEDGLFKPESLDLISVLSRDFQGVPILVLGESDNLRLMVNFIRAGVRGFIPEQATREEIDRIVAGVADGGAFVSSSVITKVFNYLHRKSHLDESLTFRQRQIAEAILDGLSYKLIAAKYEISIDTVRQHIKNIYKVLRINSKAELMAILKFHYF